MQKTEEFYPAPITPAAPNIAVSGLMTIQSGPNTPVRIGNSLKILSIPTSSSALKKSVTASERVGCLYKKMAPVQPQPQANPFGTRGLPLLLIPLRYTRVGRGGCSEPPKSRRPMDVFFGPSNMTTFDGPSDPPSKRRLASVSVKISVSSLWNVSRSCARRSACERDGSSSSGITNRRGPLDERMRESRPDG